jgi:flagellar protein FliT
MTSRLALLEQMSTLSDRMVAAAIVNDWDTLIQYERGVAALREQLRADDAKVGADEAATQPGSRVNNISPAVADGATAAMAETAHDARESAREQALIGKILDDAAEIRRHVEPWLAHVGEFLGHRQRRREVARAYAASDDGVSS